MEIRKIRAQMRMGRSIYDFPLRVTFYARVSTDHDEQINSLENQVQYYTELIQSKKNWTFVPGYIDEGISGTSTKKRNDFNRMIRDARAGLFDFIITKEISRFSRSTLDSIQYTQELLDYNVGVFFQNDNINTLDTDSEFRLIIMAGVAQDEVRKLSERLKFGFRQAIRNGHVLGNDTLYGYDKKDCVLTINEEEAKIVRTIFALYADKGYGTRKISKELLKMGYTSRRGNAFNTLTIRHILENPKYKGWFCGNKTQSLDYRSKKQVYLEESEWVMYPDPNVPAIVSEDLWNRANALYKTRKKEVLERTSGRSYHNRYPYSTKILCQEHGTCYYRQLQETKQGKKEVWQCKVYRTSGRTGCSAPQVASRDLDIILARIFRQLLQDKKAMMDWLIAVLNSVPPDVDYGKLYRDMEQEIRQLEGKKERLLELHMAGALTVEEFKQRNDGFHFQIRKLETQRDILQAEETRSSPETLPLEKIRQVLERELSLDEPINTKLVTSILDKIVVKKGSTKEEIHLDIYLKFGYWGEVVYAPDTLPKGITEKRNTTHKPLTRKT